MYSERQREMLRYLSEVKFAKVEQLSDLFHVSIETIRRDLLELEKDSSVKRIRGGATYSKSWPLPKRHQNILMTGMPLP